jgi:hypothetical protein
MAHLTMLPASRSCLNRLIGTRVGDEDRVGAAANRAEVAAKLACVCSGPSRAPLLHTVLHALGVGWDVARIMSAPGATCIAL